MGPVNRLYDGLRGAATLVEGLEFLLTHRPVVKDALRPFAASVALIVLAGVFMAPLRSGLAPFVPGLTLPWYFVLFEWGWSAMPSLLAALLLCVGIEILYFWLAAPGTLVDAVAVRRGATHQPATLDRIRFTGWVGGMSLGCAGIAAAGGAGVAIAGLVALPMLGGGMVWAIACLRGWAPAVVRHLLSSRLTLCGGLGAALLVGSMVPILNLAVFPCATIGVTCLILREERNGPLKPAGK